MIKPISNGMGDYPNLGVIDERTEWMVETADQNKRDMIMALGRKNGKTYAAIEYMKKMGITPEAQAWIEDNKESIDKQYEGFLEANGQGVVVGVDLANGSDYAVRDGVVIPNETS